VKYATLVDATDLDARADRLEGRAELPHLLRRLVVRTTPSLKSVAFRTGEGIQYPGWDGRVETDEGTPWVPRGVSAWEAGVGDDRKGKADDDYRRRSEKPLDVDPKETTFVFATLRRWSEKAAWASVKREEGLWRDVHAYDADDIEAWLESAPSVHLAFSRLLGKRTPATVDLESWWDDWRAETEPPLTAALLLAGRSKAAKAIEEWLGLEIAQPIALQAESIEEAVAVLAACVTQMSPVQRDRNLGRAIVVRDRESWDRYTEMESQLLLIPRFREDSQGAVSSATRRGDSVYVPLDRSSVSVASAIQVPRLSWEPAKDALVAMGKSESAARQLATLARRSLLGLRRKMGIRLELQQPAWAAPEPSRKLLPLVLAGAWLESYPADQAAVAKLAGASYAKVRDVAKQWANAEDPPIRRIDETWMISSKEDAWTFVGRTAFEEDLRRFVEVAVETLGEPDPRYDLPAEKRFMASILGKAAPTSSALRESLADTIAMLGARGVAASTHNAAALAGSVVHQLLERANADWKVWASISPFLPRLAEGAPDAFLTGIETGLKLPSPLLLRLFDDGGDAMFSSSPHTGLLSALEVLAWNADYLPRAALALAVLCRLDPGGKTLNRPLGSLLKIFLPWLPRTSATIEQRFKVLDRLRAKEQSVAWQLFRDLLPERTSSMTFPTAEPRWREWTPDGDTKVDALEYRRTVSGIVERLLQDVGVDGSRWNDLISRIDTLPAEAFNTIVERLSTLDLATFAPSAGEQLWDALRECVATHRNFSSATWALPGEQVDRIEALVARFQPTDPVPRHVWLFDHTPKLLLGQEDDWERRQESLRAQRLSAAVEVHAAGGLDALVALASRAAVPGIVGDAVGEQGLLAPEDERTLLLTGVASESPALASLVRGFVLGRQRVSASWAQEALAVYAKTWTPLQRAEVLLCLPDDAGTWDRVDLYDEETRRLYWERARPYPATSIEDCVRVVRALIQHGRSAAAVDILGLVTHRRDAPMVPSDLVLEVLEAFRNEPGPTPHTPTIGYTVRALLDRLGESGEVDESRLAVLEWAFLPLLEHQGGPTYLYRELQRSHEFFNLLLSFAYPLEGKSSRDVTPDERARAERAYDVLHRWHLIPGRQVDGTLDPELLTAWVRQAREVATRDGRREIADLRIGQILASAPPCSDGIFPHSAVREILENAESSEMEGGFETAVLNSRGMYTKDPSTGGDQERALAKKYGAFADALVAESPRTAAALRRLEAHYLAWASREDSEAEMRHDHF
jgi:hypothetical protein